jgi:3-hydroxy-3-methylglutaryl CoA synthase
MSLLICDLDFAEENSKSRFISITGSSGITPSISTALSTSLDTKLLTFLDIDKSPAGAHILAVAVGSGAGAAAAAVSVGGRSIAISRASA